VTPPVIKVAVLTAAEQIELNALCLAVGRCKVYRTLGITDHVLRAMQRGEPVQQHNLEKVRAGAARLRFAELRKESA
jgi:hypothetical protein